MGEPSTTSALLPSWNIDTGPGAVAPARLLTLPFISLGEQGKQRECAGSVGLGGSQQLWVRDKAIILSRLGVLLLLLRY